MLDINKFFNQQRHQHHSFNLMRPGKLDCNMIQIAKRMSTEDMLLEAFRSQNISLTDFKTSLPNLSHLGSHQGPVYGP